MSPGSTLDEESRLVLTEVVNIALGHATGPLSELVGDHVVLSVPEVEDFPVTEIPERLARMIGAGSPIHLVGQCFRPHLRGECWLLLHDPAGHALRCLLLPGEQWSPDEERALVLELANIVIGACIGKIAEVLETETTFSPPILHLYQEPVGELSPLLARELDTALLVRTSFTLEGADSFEGLLVVLLPTANLSWLIEALARFVGDA